MLILFYYCCCCYYFCYSYFILFIIIIILLLLLLFSVIVIIIVVIVIIIIIITCKRARRCPGLSEAGGTCPKDGGQCPICMLLSRKGETHVQENLSLNKMAESHKSLKKRVT